MAISLDWGNKIIFIPKSYLTLVSGTLYQLDSNQLRLDLKDIEDNEEGITHSDTHRHNSETTIASVIYAQTIELINGYKIEFEDGQYTVKIVNSNNNFADVDAGKVIRNQVSIVSTNSAGLIKVVSGSGVTAQDKIDIINGIWNELVSSHTITSTFGKYIQDIKTKTDTINWTQIELLWDEIGGKREIANNQEIFYKADNTTEVMRFNLFDSNGLPTMTNVYKRERV